MPIYEYECEACQKILEVTQKITEEPLKTCPECKSPIRKLISRSSIAFKGTGFYTTDYKRPGNTGNKDPKKE
ncbi:zinc ribbon domain-containing protein [bacterium]|nr:zinc ribbon domain-containing protein [bacterium]